MADSHDNMKNVEKAVEIFNKAGVEKVLHAGDIVAPFVTRVLKRLSCEVLAVYGNNDGEKLFLKKNFEEINKVGKIKEPPQLFELDDKRFYLTHNPNQIDILAKSGEFDVVVYGHTHDLDLREIRGCLIINPGETGGWLRERATVVILDTYKMKYEVFEL